MNISLHFEDLFTLQQDLKWEFKDSVTEFTVNQLRKIVLDSFNQASEILNLPNTPPFQDREIEIKLLLRGMKGSPTLAYFDMYDLTLQSTKFSFKLFSDVLFPLLKSGDLQTLKSIWLHEITHLIDYIELLENLKIYREKRQEISSYNFSFSNREIRKDKHIILLQLMMQFRAEGLATLVEYVMGGSPLNLVPPHLAKEKFDEIISSAIDLISTAGFNSAGLARFIEETNPIAYQIGAGIVLHGLMKKYPDLETFTEIDACLENEIPCNCAIDERLFTHIRMFDSFNFIEYSYDQELLYAKVRELTADYADSLANYSGFFDMLSRIRNKKDREGFVALIQNIIEEPLIITQIKEAHRQKSADTGVPLEVREHTNALYEYLQLNKSDEVCLWALTYFYDNEDLLDDSIEYFGYIDDIEVLKTAWQIIAG